LKLVNVIFDFLVCREYQSLEAKNLHYNLQTHRVKRKKKRESEDESTEPARERGENL
jgi:hypothetical protein